ncbi:hypothetical protein KOI35_26330 [Actinoplanes bogorensis]|uniref:DUF4175 domain-containing protein n=1 Tax=Paractinoplanes bogorensis TaxID=1610840 RepID=A0ABS5YY50_9ACTN|nr:hypothetical protein [Actinoplanes bogorensis]MBU2667035.1 hypothetical protein [Actinoplanes bogorensis]
MGCLGFTLVFFGIIAVSAWLGDPTILWLDGWLLLGGLIWFIVRSSGPYQRS